ncbi:MAG: helix-turn-helix transcriptional regulator [Lachnospiraceae bacterium]|nr:helix-turn-helix transcriptional regulator [Lachnospiraceae bacterium]
MDQKKIGAFLKELRKEQNLTQEQLAEVVGVTNRSISRWENGVNMPDFDLVIELTNYFEVSIEEFLDGERKREMMDKKTEETLLKVTDYENMEKMKFSKRLCRIFLAAIAAFLVYAVIDMQGLASTGMYEDIASFALGFVFGVLILGALVTSRYMAKIRALKLRILRRTGTSNS